MFRKEILIIPLILAAVLFLLVRPALRAPYNIEDDYHYIKVANPDLGFFQALENPETYRSFGNFYKKYNEQSGRFRPLSIVMLWSISKVSDSDPRVTEAIIFLFALAVLVLFYCLMRLIGLDMLLSLLFTCMFMTWRYDQVWYRRTGELFGLLFLFSAFVLFILSARKNAPLPGWLGVLGILLASLAKESFAALIPSCCILLILVYSKEKKITWKESLKFTARWQLSLVILFSLISFAVFHSMMSDTTYAFKTSVIDSVSLMPANFIRLAGPLLWWLPLLVVVFSLFREKKITAEIFLGGLAWVLWIVSQLVVYKETKVSDYGRYLLPATIFPLIFSGACLSRFQTLSGRKIYSGFILLLVLFVLTNSKNVFINSSYYAARATSYHRMLNDISRENKDVNAGIVILVEEGGLYDFMESTAVFLSKEGVNRPISYFEILNNGNVKRYSPAEIITDARKVKATRESGRNELTEELKKPGTQDIIFTTPFPFSKLNPESFEEGFQQLKKYPETYFNSGWAELFTGNFNRRDTIQYFILKK